MVRFLLCDDDEAQAKQLERMLLARYGHDKVDISVFTGPTDALEYIENGGRCDAAILDIIMPGLSGTKLAMKMRKLDFSGAIIFLTTSRNYAPESYEADALDYLLKPIDAERLNRVLDKLEAHIHRQDNEAILLTVGRVTKRLLFRDIQYAEAGDHIVRFSLDNGSTLSVRGSLSAYAPVLLGDTRFAACHSSFIVNMDKIHALDNNDVVLHDGYRIPISRRYTSFRKQYMKWLIQEG